MKETEEQSGSVLRIGSHDIHGPHTAVAYRFSKEQGEDWDPAKGDIPRVRTLVAEQTDEFTAHVTMQYKPVRLPATVCLTISELSAAGSIQPHRRETQALPMSPAAARALAKLLVDMAEMAEDMDTKPYPKPEESVPPLDAAARSPREVR